MRRATVFLLFAAALSVFAADLPRKAIPFAVQTAPEKYIWLSEYSGKTVVLAFILTTCPHCQFTTGVLSTLQKEYAAKGVVFIESAIEPMSALHIPDFKKQLNVTFPVGYNEQNYAATLLNFPQNEPMLLPQIVVIDAQGMIRSQFSGDDVLLANGIQETTLRDAIEKALKPAAKAK